MRFQYLLHVAAGGLICAPAILGEGDTAPFTSALAQTEKSLNVLEGIQADLAAGDVEAIRHLRSMTEAAPAPSGLAPAAGTPAGSASGMAPEYQPEDRLAELRYEVAQLDEELARLELNAQQKPVQTDYPGAATAAGSSTAPAGPASVVTTGLTDAQRIQIALQSERPTIRAAAAERTAHEGEGYVADELRLGRALYRNGSYAEAAAVLTRLDSTPEAAYWRARALEKLTEFDDALKAYTLTTTLDSASEWAQRAKRDAEFLRWQIALERKITRP